jgi:phosphate/sulfate permease
VTVRIAANAPLYYGHPPAGFCIPSGYPISSNEMMISSIDGAGLVGRSSNADGVSTTKTGHTVGTWVASMVGGGVISFALFHALAALPGLG